MSDMRKTTTTERVQRIMAELGIDEQAEFGRLCGTSRSMVFQWLTGEIKTIGAKYAFKLEEKTGFSAKWIMLGEGEEKRSRDPGATPTERFAYIYTHTNDLGRAMINAVLNEASTAIPHKTDKQHTNKF